MENVQTTKRVAPSPAVTTSIDILRQISQPVKNLQEGIKIARKLTDTLTRINKKSDKKSARTQGKVILPKGLGLSAIQLEIPKQVFVLNVTSPISFINPVILSHSEETITWEEQCLSLPGVKMLTSRWLWLEVQCLNWPRPKMFGMRKNLDEGFQPQDLLECVAVQHELEHLQGRLILDFPQTARKDEAGQPEEVETELAGV